MRNEKHPKSRGTTSTWMLVAAVCLAMTSLSRYARADYYRYNNASNTGCYTRLCDHFVLFCPNQGFTNVRTWLCWYSNSPPHAFTVKTIDVCDTVDNGYCTSAAAQNGPASNCETFDEK